MSERVARRVLAPFGLLLALSGPVAPAHAFDSSDGAYIIHGAGQTPCAEWTADRMIDRAGAWQLQQWALGYLTAFNEWVRGSADIANGLDAAAVFAWIDDYCDGHRLDGVASAVQEFVRTRQDGFTSN